MYAINQKKVQNEIINNMFKINKRNYTRVDKDNSVFTYVMINTHSIFKLFKGDCYIVENNLKFKKAIEDIFGSFDKERTNYKEAQLANNLIIKDKCKINILETDGLKVYFNNDMLKYFEKKEIDNVKWFVKSPKEPIFVVESTKEVICMILPIYLKDN